MLSVFARSDDYFFGVLHSRLHEVWALKLGTRLETRPRYTPTTCFETFPFPEPPLTPTLSQREREQSGRGPASPSPLPPGEGQGEGALPPWQAAIAEAAKELDALRQNWLNPPEWVREEVLEFPGSAAGPWARFIVPSPQPSPGGGGSPSPSGRGQGEGVGTVRYPRLVPKDEAAAAELKKRTLTALYNARPEWLANAHRQLDAAVFAAYGWPATLTDEEILARLLELNLAAKRVGDR